MASRPPLSDVLPPLLLGTATFNTQYHPDPSHMPYTQIVDRALANGITGFDTSPYYGPSEILLGEALQRLTPPPPRERYFLVTKAGRIASAEFDYSPSWIRHSVHRSLQRLGTPYLDLVYAHDVEFVSTEEALGAIRELRRLRDAGVIRYVGISGYDINVLTSVSELVLKETGEPLDAVLSYSHFCVQNETLGRPEVLGRFRSAGVQCVLNASMLGMGLLTSRGVDHSPMSSWHPAPPDLRKACHDLAKIAHRHGEHLEAVAIRWALDAWAHIGAPLGTRSYPAELTAVLDADDSLTLPRQIGVSVMGVSAVEELEETCKLWRNVVSVAGSTDSRSRSTEAERKDKIFALVRDQMRPSLGSWKDYAWQSGVAGYVNQRVERGVVPSDDGVAERWGHLPAEQIAAHPHI